ncbi:hypothetical protein ACWEOI_29800 [Nocardia sp. NPDC004340]
MRADRTRGLRPGPAVELYFASAANNLAAAARTLEEILLDAADPHALRVRLSAFERVSRQLTEQLVRLLVAGQFAVPDRTELYRVGSLIDYAVDRLESVGRMIEIHCLTVFPDEVLHLIRLGADAAWVTAQGLTLVRHPVALPPYWLELHRISENADHALTRLRARPDRATCPAALSDIGSELADLTHLLADSARTMRGVTDRWNSVQGSA